MIKITVGDFVVEVDSIEEARNFLGMTRVGNEVHKEEKAEKRVVKHRKHSVEFLAKKASKEAQVGKKPKRIKSSWLPEEIDFMLKNISVGGRVMSESKYLLARHPKWGIQQMYWKCRNNSADYKVPEAIQKQIDEFHANKK